MDAEDTRIAQERIDHTLARVSELQSSGIDTADLASQLSFARSALEQGRTLDVLAICEEVLLSSRKLAGTQPRTPPPAPEQTNRYASGIYATPGAEALDRHRLTEEIRQVVQGDLMPKALTPAQLNERIGKMVDKAFAARLESLKSDLDERFQRLASTPETTVFAKPAVDAEHLLAEVDRKLDARAEGIAKSTAQAIADSTAGMEARLAELADPGRLRSAVSAAVESSLREGLARLDLERQESAARRAVGGAEMTAHTHEALARLTTAVEAIDASLGDRIRSVVDERIAQGLDKTIDDRLGEMHSDLDERFQRLAADPETKTFTQPEADAQEAFARITAAIDSLDARIASAVETRLAPAPTTTTGAEEVIARLGEAVDSLDLRIATAVEERLAGATQSIAASVSQQMAAVAPPPADLDAVVTRLGKDLRDDFAWQVERLAAERGWVSLADVQAELGRGGAPTPAGNTGSAGFARLEAALVEFVRQTQSQQQEFLAVLREKVERGTAVVAQQMAGKHSSEPFAAPTADTGSILRPDHGERSALESNAEKASEASLDVLSQSAQFRAISTLGDPQRPATGHFLPGTQVTRRVDTPAEADLEAGTVPTALEAVGERGTRQEPAEIAGDTREDDTDDGVDSGSETAVQLPMRSMDLGTEVMELQPLAGSALRPAVAPVPATRREPVAEPGSGSRAAQPDAAESSDPAAPATSALARTTGPTPTPGTGSQIADSAPTTGTGRMTGRVAALEASLRLLVRKEVTQQLGSGGPTSGTRLQPTEAGSGAPSALAPNAGPLQRDELVRLLQDPGVRQQVLGIVAVEALGNPGALGELTGIRAFIRAEVRKAAQEGSTAPDAEKASDVMT